MHLTALIFSHAEVSFVDPLFIDRALSMSCHYKGTNNIGVTGVKQGAKILSERFHTF